MIFMEKKGIILYIHGMGGGGDSRIPSILNGHIDECSDGQRRYEVVVRTYSFDPDTAWKQICSWVEELGPELVIGESLGSLNAMKISGLPHVFVSPSINAPVYLGYFAFVALIPGIKQLFERIYRPKPGDRQQPDFSFRILRKYRTLRREALQNSPENGSRDGFFAFFGTNDHYRKSGIVSIRTYRKYFGDTFQIYEGTHFMEEEFILSMLIPKIREILASGK